MSVIPTEQIQRHTVPAGKLHLVDAASVRSLPKPGLDSAEVSQTVADDPDLPSPGRRRQRLSWYERSGKRVFDIVVATVSLVAFSPVMAFTWLALRVTLGRDVVITQDRVGRNGETFGMLKFRTMHWSRRGRSASFNGTDRRVSHKVDSDPRHTPIGRAFRKLSFDELPQLINVLVGDMSVVGPRPELATVVDGIGQRAHPRHRVRPGMTGAWQVTERQTGVPLHESFDSDLPYLNRVSLHNDIAILVRTVGVVLGRSGR